MHDRTFKREFSLDRAKINEAKREVELSFSSELVVDRYFGKELLSHEPGAVDLSPQRRDTSRQKSRGSRRIEHSRKH